MTEPISVFVCGAPAHRCKCGAKAVFACAFELGGRRSGEKCDAHLCERCAVTSNAETFLCGPHARLKGLKV